VTVDVTGNDSDPNGDTLSVTSVTQGAHGATNINPDGTVQYQPNANFHGTDSFSYTVSDGNGGSDSATVTITVTAVNDAPSAVDDSATCRRNQRIDIAVLSNDSDGDGDAIQIVSVTKPASGGTTIINPNGTIRYRAKPGFTGTDTFNYTIEDGNGGVATATVTVSVTAH
jgi:VCBS repeat-containing protein